MGFAMIRFKKHKFYTNLLKSFDPLIMSAGFHKYQTIPMLAKKDMSDRLRLIKYTPQHDFCHLIVYGPFLELNTGISIFQSMSEDTKKFRVAGTGVVIGFAPNYDVKKKLRLVGEPFKIFKNTSFVKGMFNSRVHLAHSRWNWLNSLELRSKQSVESEVKSRRHVQKDLKEAIEQPSKTKC